jgi:hypothetical protein
MSKALNQYSIMGYDVCLRLAEAGVFSWLRF